MSKVEKILDKQLERTALEPLADELGQIKAELTKLEKRKKAIAGLLKDAGIHEIEGELFRAVCSDIDDSYGVDWEKIAIANGATERQVEHPANQRVTKKAHVRISVYARTGDDV
jgi:hypothetical protein